mmetsp:Transcript_100155/g.137954  ORF Transcript_100155/g.137954 Transcript_100155/m.137954 type:complete len:277 (+) Transcript_100155:72-902(+)
MSFYAKTVGASFGEQAASSPTPSPSTGHFVIRNTFLELVEDKQPSQRGIRRSKTDSIALLKREYSEEACSTEYGTSDEETPEEILAEGEDSDKNDARAATPARSAVTPAEEPAQVQKSESKAAGKQEGRQGVEKPKTTLMLRNLPNNYTRQMLLDLLNEEGFEGQYDFVYLPVDFNSGAGLGYAFVNVADPAVVSKVWAALDGYKKWTLPTSKVCDVGWGDQHQGLKAKVQRYRNSPVMHESVPDECKPVLFVDGVRAAFPKPSKKLQAPRHRCRK